MEDAHGHGGHAELFKPIGCTLDHAFYFPTREQKSTRPALKTESVKKFPWPSLALGSQGEYQAMNTGRTDGGGKMSRLEITLIIAMVLIVGGVGAYKFKNKLVGVAPKEIGRASCRERV